MAAIFAVGQGLNMLKRAQISSVIAVIAGLFGFSGILHGSASIAQTVFYLFGALSVLSLLFGLFEEVTDSTSQATTGKEDVSLYTVIRPAWISSRQPSRPATRP